MHYLQALQGLTVKELIHAIGNDQLSAREKRSRELLEEAIHNSFDFQTSVVGAYEEKEKGREEEEQRRVKRCRFLQEGYFHPRIDNEDFATCVDEKVINEATQTFIDHTGNDQMKQSICVVCAGEFFKSDTDLHILDQLKHKDCLQSVTCTSCPTLVLWNVAV
ncbi:hypothetical protein JVT61DRAFT_4752 [Boletus reticuloceps]|uniref:Uncharacterized protein n=1 Tax=Boletus reticuloceps TaxID=495285 RepID=A0A8I3A706_9AGAM|nr:hypothetical protein JVT61DRAFT_4752 [Boletus reticuloceps]